MKRIQLLIVVFMILTSCAYNDISENISCDDSNLVLTLASKTDVSSCKSINGSLVVSATGGQPAYDFSLNSGVYQTNPEFTGLAPGIYEVMVKDAKGCTTKIVVEISSSDSNLSASIETQNDSQCLTNNGAITVIGQGGSGNYQYQLGSSGFSNTNTFSNLKHGSYVVVVKDSEDCQKVISVSVPRGNTGVSFSSDIESILQTNCNLSGCHGSGTGSRDYTNFANVQSKAVQIKTRTGNKSMPIGGLTLSQQQIDLIACWVDDGAKNN
jgi:hypothetical protein